MDERESLGPIERYFRLILLESYGYDKARGIKVSARRHGWGVEVRVPKRFVGTCIGRGGENVMVAQRDFGVKINVRSVD